MCHRETAHAIVHEVRRTPSPLRRTWQIPHPQPCIKACGQVRRMRYAQGAKEHVCSGASGKCRQNTTKETEWCFLYKALAERRAPPFWGTRINNAWAGGAIWTSAASPPGCAQPPCDHCHIPPSVGDIGRPRLAQITVFIASHGGGGGGVPDPLVDGHAGRTGRQRRMAKERQRHISTRDDDTSKRNDQARSLRVLLQMSLGGALRSANMRACTRGHEAPPVKRLGQHMRWCNPRGNADSQSHIDMATFRVAQSIADECQPTSNYVPLGHTAPVLIGFSTHLTVIPEAINMPLGQPFAHFFWIRRPWQGTARETQSTQGGGRVHKPPS